MEPADILRQRLQNQHLEGPRLSKPREVVHWLGAVQSQDASGAAWAICQRTSGAALTDFSEAFARGDILRTHVMRPTWHFVVAEDIRWLLDLTAPRLLLAARYYFQKYQMTDVIFGRAEALISHALEDGQHRTRTEIATLLTGNGLDIHDQVHLAHIIIHAEATGLICSGVPRGKQQTYALLSERAPHAVVRTREDALAELAERYFRSHGPATLQDYAWWSGLTVADARAGLHMIKTHLIHETVDGQTYWFTPAGPSVRAGPQVHLLPNYDEYVVAYADRGMLFDTRHTVKLDSRQNPLFNNAIVIDGRIEGVWKAAVKRKAVAIETNLFTPLQEMHQHALTTAASFYAEYAGLPVSLSVSNT